MKKANNKIILIVIVCFIMACVSTDDNKGLHKISQISWFCEINSWKDSMDNPINTTIQIINAVISADGSTIAAMGYDKNSDLYKIHAWNTATGCLINSIDLPEASFHSLGIAPDGKYIVTGIWEQEITVYNLKSCKVIKTIKEPFLRSFILSSDGKLILTGGSGGIIKIYDFKTKNLLQEIDAFKNYTENFTINSNNTIFAAHGDGDNVVVGDIITGDIFLRLSTSELYCLALSSDGKYLVGGESNEPLKIIIWDLESGEQINTLDRGWTNENITSLFISNNNQYIIAVSLNSTLEIWEVATGKLINNLNAHEDGIMTVKMTSDEISFITAGLDMKIKLWQIPTISSHITQLDFPDDFSHVEKYRTMPVDTRVKNVPAEIYNFLHESTVIFFEELVKYLLTDEGDPFMQVKLLHDWIMYYMNYDYKDNIMYELYSSELEAILTEKKGTCYHYSILFNKLCELAEIESYSLAGTAKTGYGDWGPHSWNRVKINGLWYLVDVTFDDIKGSNKYLFTDPEIFILDHFPSGFENQMLDRIVMWDEFINSPLP